MSRTENSDATKPPVGRAATETFLLEAAEHQPQRGAWHMEPGGQWDLADALPEQKLAAQEQLAHLQRARSVWDSSSWLVVSPLTLTRRHAGDMQRSCMQLLRWRRQNSALRVVHDRPDALLRRSCRSPSGRPSIVEGRGVLVALLRPVRGLVPSTAPSCSSTRIYNPQDMERTFAIIKPDAVAARYTRAGSFNASKTADSPIRAMRLVSLTQNRSRGLLRRASGAAVLRQPDGFHVVRALSSSLALEAPDAIKKWRTLMGATDPAKADAEHPAQGLRRLDREQRHPRLRRARTPAAYEIGYFFRGPRGFARYR